MVATGVVNSGTKNTRKTQHGEASRPLRVVHIIPVLVPHGAETVLYRLVTSPSEVEQEIISLGPAEYYSTPLQQKGVRVYHLNANSAVAEVLRTARLMTLIRKTGADVVQCWMYRGNLLGGIAGRLAGKPVVWNIRCSDLAPLGFASRMLAYAGGALARWIPSAVINCSARSAELHARWGYGAPNNIIIPNGYDPAIFHPDDGKAADFRASLGIGPAEFLIGCIARWHPQKGVPVLLDAVSQLRGRGASFRAVLVGRGLDEANGELTTLIRDHGCTSTVKALGEQSDIPQVARALDLHVLASIGGEGFPNVVAETMLSGTPNVATDVGDSALIVGDTGWIVPPGDPSALADAIEAAYCEWRSARRKWAASRDAARQRIVESFSLQRMVERYEHVWHKAARKAG